MNDHIPDPTKMMSDTPISDSTPHNVADLGMLCRRMERELNAANQRIKRLEEAKKTIDDLKLRVKRDFETILKFKAENEWLIKKIEQLYEVAEQQKRTIKELEEVNEYLRQKNDKLEYGRISK